jgi:hypothetical protein
MPQDHFIFSHKIFILLYDRFLLSLQTWQFTLSPLLPVIDP